jgi:hypothetical protein
MISHEEKRIFIINRINNIDAQIKSFIDNAEICAGKYSVDEEVLACNAKKEALIQELDLLTNQG